MADLTFVHELARVIQDVPDLIDHRWVYTLLLGAISVLALVIGILWRSYHKLTSETILEVTKALVLTAETVRENTTASAQVTAAVQDLRNAVTDLKAAK